MTENKITDFSYFKFPAGLPASLRMLIDEDHLWGKNETDPKCYYVNTPEESYKAYLLCQMYRFAGRDLPFSIDRIFKPEARRIADALDKTTRTPALSLAIAEMESHLPVIDPALNAFQVYGYNFDVESDTSLPNYALFQIGLAVLSFGPYIVRFFARGLYEDKPLKIFSTIIPNLNNLDFPEFFSSVQLFLDPRPLPQGAYWRKYNLLTLDVTGCLYQLYPTMRHELWHAVDDFMFPCAQREAGSSYSETYGNVFEKPFREFLKRAGLSDEEVSDYLTSDHPLLSMLTGNHSPTERKIVTFVLGHYGYELYPYKRLSEFVASVLSGRGGVYPDSTFSTFQYQMPVSAFMGDEATAVINDMLTGHPPLRCGNSLGQPAAPFSNGGVLAPR